MFIDCLEIEDNLRMSKKIPDQDSGDKMENKLDLVEQHKQKETFSVHLKPSLSKQKNDQPSDVKEDGFTNLFYEDCNHLVTNLVSGDFKNISVFPYMRNMRMNTWMLYLKNQL